MQGTQYSSALIGSILKRKEGMEKIGLTVEDNDILHATADELRSWSKEDLFALYAEYEYPGVTHDLMELYDFSKYDNPFSLMKFAIGLQVLELIQSFFPDTEHSTAYLETVSYIQQNLLDLAGYVNLQLDKDGLHEDERRLLGDVIEHLNDAHYNTDLENLEA